MYLLKMTIIYMNITNTESRRCTIYKPHTHKSIFRLWYINLDFAKNSNEQVMVPLGSTLSAI